MVTRILVLTFSTISVAIHRVKLSTADLAAEYATTRDMGRCAAMEDMLMMTPPTPVPLPAAVLLLLDAGDIVSSPLFFFFLAGADAIAAEGLASAIRRPNTFIGRRFP